jgi:hypothetical protein
MTKLKMKLIFIFLSLTVFLCIPQPARAKICGSFEKNVNDVCIKFDMPKNAHLTYSGNAWECNRGYKRTSENTCEEIKIPANSIANFIGGFNCASGHYLKDRECKKAENIENAKFFEFGADFYCAKGFRKNEELRKCEQIKIPENAKADDSSLDGWACLGGYRKEGGECKEYKLPEHAFWEGNIWKCEKGFRKNYGLDTCDKVNIPENAHAVDSTDGWLCNPGFIKNYKENKCDKKN